MKVAIGCDHAGFELKEKIKSGMSGLTFIDVGAHSPESVDYPDYISEVARAVRDGRADTGIGICGTGIGASIVANKFKGIRAALCTSEFMAEMARLHNDANVLVLGARVVDDELALRIVKKWMSTSFEGGRHGRRVEKISLIEQKEAGSRGPEGL